MKDVRLRVLIFIVAYNAERTIVRTLTRIPPALLEHYDVEVLVIDDASQDRTFESGRSLAQDTFPFALTVLTNPVNQGTAAIRRSAFTMPSSVDSTSSRSFMATDSTRPSAFRS